MAFQVPTKGLSSESDVEQKLIFPLLTEARPHGLGIRSENVVTKANIRKFSIGKGQTLKSYFPDYVLVRDGYPLCVIEAKEPGADLGNAFREARLYAAELNGIFERGINPVFLVMAVDGREVWLGEPDTAEPTLKVYTSDLGPHSVGLAALQELVNEQALDKKVATLRLSGRGKRRWRPKSMLGGRAVVDEAMPRNSFGATLADELASIFKPESREDRASVVRNAYVKSGTRSRYLKPIDKVIRASIPESHSSSILIEDSSKPKEVIAALGRDRKRLEHQVMLVVGGVGAGKSTFIDHVQEVALDADLRAKTLWVHVNMNDAPGAFDEIFDWLRDAIVDSIREQHPDIDFSDLDTLMSLYSVEVNAYKKGVGKLYASNSSVHDQKLGEELERIMGDRHQRAVCHCRYLGGEKGKLVIIVLDNCDKRTRDEQLLMFQAAQWLKREFKCLVVLPLREETYDHHRDEPPLDTALKDLVFRIEPPDFHEVLVKRVQMALDELSGTAPKTYRYELPNSMHVDYPSNDQGKYLAAIVASIFVNDKTVSRLLMGLAGRNIRRAFELFLEICNSGHIPESDILRISSTKGHHTIPLHVIMRVLLRRNKRFFDNKEAYVKNVVQSELHPDAAMGFSRLLILVWLKQHISKLGPTKLAGYFKVSDLVSELARLGLEAEVVIRELEFLVNAHCILTEDFRVNIASDTLVKISPAGVVHLDLLDDANYWAAIAEDALFDTHERAKSVAGRLASARKQYSLIATVFNAADCVANFRTARESLLASLQFLDDQALFSLPSFESAAASIEAFAAQSKLSNWLKVREQFADGSEHVLPLSREKPYGFFLDFAPDVSGLLLKNEVPAEVRSELRVGRPVRVKIIEVEPLTQKVHLSFASLVD